MVDAGLWVFARSPKADAIRYAAWLNALGHGGLWGMTPSPHVARVALYLDLNLDLLTATLRA